MMNYAPGADTPRKVHSRNTDPIPPNSKPQSLCSQTDIDTNEGIIYSEDRTKAARQDSNRYFELDQDANLPIPLDEGGFFRVGIHATRRNYMWVQYRIEIKSLSRFNFKWLSSRQLGVVEFPIPSDRDVSEEDILYAALKLSEVREKTLGNDHGKKLVSKAARWVGDYHPTGNNLE